MKLWVAVALALGVSCANAQTKLRYAHVGVANAPQTLYADEVAKLVKERTNGRVEIQVFANSQLGGVNEMVDGVRSGAISMAHHDFGSLGRIVPNTAVFNTPFMYRDPEHAMRATDPAQLLLFEAQEILSVEKHAAADDAPGWVDEAEDGEAGDGLAAARLAHQAEHLAGLHLEADAVHGAHHARPRKEMGFQILNS